jgi:hypothetical protein
MPAEWREIFALKARRAPSSPPCPVEDDEAFAVAQLVVTVVESNNSCSWRRHLTLPRRMAADGFHSARGSVY